MRKPFPAILNSGLSILPNVTAAIVIVCFIAPGQLKAQLVQPQPRFETGTASTQPEPCPRPGSGSGLEEPKDFRSRGGLLKVNLTFKSSVDTNGRTRYCYIAADGSESPTLRVNPGDLLILNLRNEASSFISTEQTGAHLHPETKTCGSDGMSLLSTNLHLHGLFIPPVCHQDDVLNTMISPGHVFEYRIRIPRTQPPGLYWYHPHVHGLTEPQVLGGASGALIVEGIEDVVTEIGGLPERVMVIRDQIPSKLAGDSSSTKESLFVQEMPSKELSFNFVPILYPEYRTPVITMKPSQKQFWRVLNASADTQVDLQLRFNLKAQPIGVVAWDGIPVNHEGKTAKPVLWQTDVPIPPGGRAEFIMTGPPLGVQATLMTLGVETTPFVDEEDSPAPSNSGVPQDTDDNTPPRPLASILSSGDAPALPSQAHSCHAISPRNIPANPPLDSVRPVRTRKLYFSEEIRDPKNPATSTVFFITEEGSTPRAFDPGSPLPNIVVHQGDVEDWTIENRSQEVHTFHIHQTHFIVLERGGVAADEPYLRDTVNVPFWDGSSPTYPSVKLRMDFRDPNIVGIFPYHCHILQHEDGGMMGLIEVKHAAR